MKKIAFHTLGCKLNFSETEYIQESCLKGNYTLVNSNLISDIYVINTCSVTENADKECKYLIRKFKKQNPSSKIIIIGCYAQLKPNEIIKIKNVDLVLSIKEKFQITKYLDDLFNENDSRVYSCDINEVKNFQTSYSINNRTRSFLKVQDGCDYKCTYCTIPRARGLSRSDTVENVIKQINEISKSDIKEIVLTGINLGDFGKSNPNNRFRQSSLLRLVKEIEKLQNNIRFRLSSIEPDLFDREIIDFISKSKKFVPHFHIPLQSGSNLILKKMKRKYDTKYYHDLIYYIKNKIPFSSIGCDVIVGFPNESDENFKETYSFLDKIDISYLHVFQFSKRNKTKASLIDNTIEKNIKINRSRILRDLSTKKRFTFYKKNIGQTRSVLFENDNKNGFLFGYTENYIRVKTKYDPGYRNQIINVKIDKLTGDGNILTKIN